VTLITIGDERGYRAVTWAAEPEDRTLIGYYRTLRAACAGAHRKYLAVLGNPGAPMAWGYRGSTDGPAKIQRSAAQIETSGCPGSTVEYSAHTASEIRPDQRTEPEHSLITADLSVALKQLP
jgi:hypothetical protein